MFGARVDLDGYNHPISFVDTMEPRRIDRVGIDLTDTNPHDLFRVLRSNLGIHLGILLAAVANEHEMPLGHPLDHVVDDPELAFSTNDESLDEFITKPKPL